MISETEFQGVRQNVLVIDDEIDFCTLMSFYLSKKNFNVSIAHSVSQGVPILHKEQPCLIIASVDLDGNIEAKLKAEIDKIPNYSPKIFAISSAQRGDEGPYNYTLKRGQDDTLFDYVKKIIEYIKKMFK